LWEVIISGRNASVLISRPSHIKNQWELRKTIVVPKITVNNMKMYRRGFIFDKLL